MKAKILILIVLVLSFILFGAVKSYAAQASASASVLIIITPREDKAEDKAPETEVQEKESSNEDKTTYVKNNQ